MRIIFQKTPRGMIPYRGPLPDGEAARLRDALNAARTWEEIVDGIVFVTRVA